MRASILIPLFAAGFVIGGCTDTPTDPADSESGDAVSLESTTLDQLADNPHATPVELVSSFADFLGIDVRESGKSGRVRERDLELVFDVTGDFVGTTYAHIDNNNGLDTQGFATSHGTFVMDVCWPARGLCGSFEGIQSGKITLDGVNFPASIAHGSGGFAGMKLKGVEVECPPPLSDSSCFTGYVLE